MKKFVCDFTFPEMPSGRMYASEAAEGGDIGMAVNNAYKQVRKRPEFRGRRISTCKVTVVEINPKRENSDS